MRSLSGKEVVRAFEKAGFKVVRVKRSHHIMKREGQVGTLSVPVHAGKDVKKGTLNSLIRASRLTREEFEAHANS